MKAKNSPQPDRVPMPLKDVVKRLLDTPPEQKASKSRTVKPKKGG